MCCYYHDKQLPEDRSSVNSQNVVYIKNTSKNGQCTT
jgi:hypothetical protein